MSLRRNVQQQNEQSFDEMFAIARHFRARGIAPGVRSFLQEAGIDVDLCAIIEAEVEPWMLGFANGFAATLVTPAGTFFEIELELSADHSSVRNVHRFTEVTATQNVNLHNRGVGKGRGALAIEVLVRLGAGGG